MDKAASREYLATEPCARLIVRLAVPSVAAQLANLLYGMVDRILLGHLESVGSDALAGLGVCLPIFAIVLSFAMLGASGAAPLASKELGRKDPQQAQRVVCHAQMLLLIATIVLMAVSYLFSSQLLTLFGASAVTMPYASEYFCIYMLGTPFVMIWNGMGLFLLAQGDSKQMLVATATGAVVHVALALLFIFVFGWGIAGAATSSVISQGLSAVLAIHFLRKQSSALRFEFRFVGLEARLVGRILSIGSGRFFIMFTEGILLIVANATLQRYGGDVYVGAMTVLYSLQSIDCVIVQGFTQGTQPIVSYCYGARKLERTRHVTRVIVVVSAVINFVLIASIMLFPEQSVSLFTNDAELAALAAGSLRRLFVGFLFFGIQLGMQTIFMGLGKGFCSLTVAAVRKVILFVPLVFLLSGQFGADGVIFAEPISDVGSVLYCMTLFFFVIPKMIKGPDEAIS